MHLCISGFLKDDTEDSTLKFSLTIDPTVEKDVLAYLNWPDFPTFIPGMRLLSENEIAEISTIINQKLPTELDLFIDAKA